MRRQPTRNIGGKERAGQEVADSDHLSVATQPGVTLWSSHIELVFHPQVEGARYALSIDWSILVTGPKADAFFEQYCEHGITLLNAALVGHRSHRE